MSIQTPALRETSANPLSNWSAGRSTSRSFNHAGQAELFSSVLGAQKSRSSLADSARQAQRSPGPAQSSNERGTEAQERMEARQRTDARSDSAGKSEDEDSRDVKKPETSEAARTQEQESAGRESAPSDESSTSGEGDVPFAATAATSATAERAATAETSSGSNAQRTVDGRSGAQNEVALQRPAVVGDEGKATTLNHARAEGGQAKGARTLRQHDPSQQQQQSARAAQARQQVDADAEPVQAKHRVKRAKPQASAEAKSADVNTRATDAAREAAKGAAHDTFRASTAQTADAPPDSSERKQARAIRLNAQAASDRTADPSATPTRDSDVQKATREAIDKLLNDRASGHADAKSNPPAPPSNANANADAAVKGAPSAPPAGTTVAATGTPTFDASAASLTTTPAVTTATTAPAAGTATLAGDSSTGTGTSNATPNTGAEWMTRSDHAAGRILRGLSAMIHQHGGSMTMRLDPPELGSLRIQMTIQNGSVNAAFTPSSAAARGLLEQNMAQLKVALESQGLMVDKLSIQTTSSHQANAHAGGQHGTDERDTDQQHADAGQGESRGRREHEGEQRGDASEFFDPDMLFDVNDTQHAPRTFDTALEERIPA